MEFRPCIDIHNGKIKQIVGGSLRDEKNQAAENFVSDQDGAFFAEFYKKDGLKGGHIILLNPAGSEYYEADRRQAALALSAYPGGLMLGGGVNAENAKGFLDQGASHVIVTSYVFKDGRLNEKNLERMVKAVGKKRLALDLSCRARDGAYYIVTDRWQKFTDLRLDIRTLEELSGCCDEFLIHAADVEGKRGGVEKPLLRMLGEFRGIPVTYAGGVGSFADLEEVKRLGQNRVNVTVGSALDLFGGNMSYRQVLRMVRQEKDKSERE